jgi:hypothetical protein
MSTAPASNKYQIKFLEEEIGLFDRKLAHLLKFETFANEQDRKAAASRLSTKRDRLLLAVNKLNGEEEPVPAPKPEKKKATKPRAAKKAAVAVAEIEAETVLAPEAIDGVSLADSLPAPRPPSPYTGTSLDYEQGLDSYLQSRRKTS